MGGYALLIWVAVTTANPFMVSTYPALEDCRKAGAEAEANYSGGPWVAKVRWSCIPLPRPVDAPHEH